MFQYTYRVIVAHSQLHPLLVSFSCLLKFASNDLYVAFFGGAGKQQEREVSSGVNCFRHRCAESSEVCM